MRVLITGSDGFIGKNLQLILSPRQDVEVRCFDRSHSLQQLPEMLEGVDFVFHLAGVNRPQDPAEFASGNTDLTATLCQAVATQAEAGKRIPVIYTSSIQAAQTNPYGESKRGAEDLLFALGQQHGVPVHVFRLPNVFGKWTRPNYNSVVATFCHNIARGLPIQVNNPDAALSLVYVDDVVQRFVQLMDGAAPCQDAEGFDQVQPVYATTVGQLAEAIKGFRDNRDTLMIDRVGTGLTRALYATYVSYLEPAQFSYTVPMHGDARGVFVEMLKTQDSGQFSYFTAHPGITRGGHYHHTKTEKFLVIKGKALFRFRHMQTGEYHELHTDGSKAEVVETVPGWTHDITNVGQEEMVVMLWANEIFDRERPDTYACPL
ncbi:UDP-2-acetamido-2,6-beta-L-arabino-hexul-4-ose reductase [Brachymonas denitrificans]|uniref:UDP-2-acetamido-2,6-beta-L-arabino-hexul-4-ose reductase n=1 Tax=Brachymonas denitrificans DSM 15123 TaxID=1121117 RepID=A0A1H8JUV9_9BURK|nr:capsular polysaccharide biosynthesis protein CapF [Brachymonas denitrificans]SEN84147.1 UDP-2-acetamido-2,6-beta-L-arabino-hexul-4-ose reductase [Brachymonas denitrificans DSM 15123]